MSIISAKTYNMWNIKGCIRARRKHRLALNRIHEHEGAVGVREIGSVTSGEAAEDETFGRIKRPGSTISFGGYFLNSRGNGSPASVNTRDPIRLAKTCLRMPKCLLERKIYSRPVGIRARIPNDSQIN